MALSTWASGPLRFSAQPMEDIMEDNHGIRVLTGADGWNMRRVRAVPGEL